VPSDVAALRAARAWRKATAHLAELEGQDPDRAPMAVIHSAYYAMFHAARAALFRMTGAAPRKHDAVVTAFGRLVRDGNEARRRCGRWLNAMKDGRTAADYGEDFDPPADEARQAVQLARDFAAACAAEFGFDGGRVADN
jgi:uncharacterized protein (UPF0332 family)